jgi:hypothetical protein
MQNSSLWQASQAARRAPARLSTSVTEGRLESFACQIKPIAVSNFEAQKAKFQNDDGFIAALDQSGGSTPKALRLYGIDEECLEQRRGDVRPGARRCAPAS